jgi:hypothetical protein
MSKQILWYVYGRAGQSTVTKVQGTATSFSASTGRSANMFVGTKIAQEPAYVYKIMGSANYGLCHIHCWLTKSAVCLRNLTVAVKQLIWKALFEVKNRTGQTVFAVYNEGVRVYVDDGSAKE